MKVSFFDNEGKFDLRAAGGGVFMISVKDEKNDKLPLYIRESINMAAKSSEILKILYKTPEYLGLSKGIVMKEETELVFEILAVLPIAKTFSTMGVYRDAEVSAIRELKPLVQNKDNHFLLNEGKRCALVKQALGIE